MSDEGTTLNGQTDQAHGGNPIVVCLRRQMRAAAALRLTAGAVLLAGLVACGLVGSPTRRWIVVGLVLLAAVWILLSFRGVLLLRRARHGAALLAAGRVEQAQRDLVDVLGRFTLLRSVKIMAGHQLAVATHAGGRYAEAIAICREVLRHRLRGARSAATGLRLILADSLLMLDQIEAAGPVMQAMDAYDLSLADRMTLLPIKLRYQLSAGRDAEAAGSLPDKVRLAELLDSSSAALAHALLAEACRRAHLPQQQHYLLQRAELLADLGPIVGRYPQLLGDLGIGPDPTEPAETAQG
jgi:hypothetical protein